MVKQAKKYEGPKPLLDFSGPEPWFKPKQFWKHWAAYYPVSWQGWTVTCMIFIPLIIIWILIVTRTSSIILCIIRFLPFFLIALILYDNTTLKRGTYPSWWKGKRKSKSKL